MNQKIDDLKSELQDEYSKLRAENSFVERARANLMQRLWNEERERFAFAENSQALLKDKNALDTMLILDALEGWHSKAPKEKKKVYLELFLAILRIQNYTDNLETLNQHAVAKYVTEVNLSKRSLSAAHAEKLKLQLQVNAQLKEIDALKKEIEFLNKP